MNELCGIQIQNLSERKTAYLHDIFAVAYLRMAENGIYDSKAADLYDFEKFCLKNISNIDFGTAAYEDIFYFADKYHNHDDIYNRISVEQIIFSNDNQISIGNYQADGSVYTQLYAPILSVQTVKITPEIGTIKFLAVYQTYDIDENQSDFNGWCWADGRALDKNEWLDAFNVFGYNYSESDSSDYFNIPNLSQFIRPLIDGYKNSDQFKLQDYDVYIPRHFHTADVMLTGDINIKMKLRVSKSACGPGGAIHSGQPAPSPWTNITFNKPEHKINIKLSKLNITGEIDSAGATEEAYPDYNVLPVMIYIGHKS